MKLETIWSLNHRKYFKGDTDWFDSVLSKTSVWQNTAKLVPRSVQVGSLVSEVIYTSKSFKREKESHILNMENMSKKSWKCK